MQKRQKSGKRALTIKENGSIITKDKEEEKE